MSETALTLKQAAERLQVSYGTVFERRHEIAFRLPGSRIWRIWPSALAALNKPRNNVTRLSLRNQDSECPSAKIKLPESGGSIYARQAAKELGMMFKTPVKPGWRKRSAAGTMAS